MNRCTLYTHQTDTDALHQLIQEHLPSDAVSTDPANGILTATIKGGLFRKAKTLTASVQHRQTPGYELSNQNDPFERNLNGMQGFVSSIKTDHTTVRNRFLIKIGTVNTAISFTCEPGYTEAFKDLIRATARHYEAFLFVEADEWFTAAPGQHFVDEELRLLFDTQGNSEVDDLKVNIDADVHDGPAFEPTPEQIDRRAKNVAALTAAGIPTLQHLPLVKDSQEVDIRDEQAILDRIYALYLLLGRAQGVDADKLATVKAELNIDQLSYAEEVLLADEAPTEQALINAWWRIESLQVLLWALGHLEELPPATDSCHPEEIFALVQQQSREDFTAASQLQPAGEILDATDLVYQQHWAVVDARLKGQEPPGGLHPGVVYERHYALNWLTNYGNADWDDVTTDT